MSSETALIAAAQNGSVAAFTELVAEYRTPLLRFLTGRAANFADAEDALQDTLVNAWRYLQSYDSRWRFSTWLYRIAINNLSAMHAGNRGERIDVEALSDGGSGPLEQCIAANERHNLWLSAKRQFSDEVYAAMWLRYVEDMSVKEISVTLDRSVSWTKVNLLRARKRLDADLNNTSATTVRKAYG